MPAPPPQSPAPVFSDRERRALVAIARAALPPGRIIPGAGAATVERLEEALAIGPAALRTAYRALIRAVDARALTRGARGVARLSPDDALALLEGWRSGGPARRAALRGLVTPLKAMYFDDPDLFDALGCRYELTVPDTDEVPPYVTARSSDADDLGGDCELEAEVVVVGSGAGGAVVAKELAESGAAVVILEEGAYFRRSDFGGRPLAMQRRLYRNAGATVALGNAIIPVPIGKTVGGTTTVNSGTCYRAPPRVLSSWRRKHGLVALTDEVMGRYYQRVERVLGVEAAREPHLGGVARVIARGCERLSISAHGPLSRNAPDCDGQGVCCFGCPTDAKRSTNVSYVPLALRAGAELVHGARVSELLTDGGRAVGVVARSSSGHRIEVRARAVVIACGALMTPVLLQETGLFRRCRPLGRNLSIHPAQAVLGRFDEDIRGYAAIPQGYAIEEFHDDGLLFEGAATPLDLTMTALPFLGSDLTDLAESFDGVAMFGFLIEDGPRGHVRSWRGQPVVTYRLGSSEIARLRRGIDLLAQIYFAAGAREVWPLVHGFDRLRSDADLSRLRRARLRPSDFELSAYHPLGSARMGIDPSSSVVDADHQTHTVPGLYVVDGSSLPSSPAVNPQMTIMALATRAAERLAARLS